MASAARSAIQKVLPAPGMLATPMPPSINSTRRLVTTRPMPLPSCAPPSCPRRLNGWNSSACWALSRPMPVSRTLMRTRPSTCTAQSMLTLPWSRLYLMAFDSRFSRICFRRVRSACTLRRQSSANAMAMPRPAASGAVMWRHSSSSGRRATGSSDRLSVPDSTLARSRISLIKVSRWRPAFRIWPANSFFCSRVDGRRSELRICAKPRMALSGVRNSWLIDDTKADLAWLALRASCIASASSPFFSSSCSVRSCTRASSSWFRRITSCCACARCSASRASSRFERSSACARCSTSASSSQAISSASTVTPSAMARQSANSLRCALCTS